MRQLTIAICLCLTACGGQEPAAGTTPASATAAPVAAAAAPVPAPSPPAVPARKLLDDYLAAWNRHDGAAAAAFFADDVVAFDALRGNLSNGRNEVRTNVVDMYLRAVPDLQWSLRGEPVVSEQGFSYEWTLAGTNMGDWTSYLRGRGQKLNFKGITIVRVKDGKITYQANYFDNNALGAQAGW